MSECKQCGECCKWLSFTINGLRNDRLLQEYYKAHGCKIKGNTVTVPMRCPHLTEDNKCDIHETKPFHCKTFKGQEGKTYVKFEGCGYGV